MRHAACGQALERSGRGEAGRGLTTGGRPRGRGAQVDQGRDEDGTPYIVEFDCNVGLLGRSYCYHVLSRGFNMSAPLVAKLKGLAAQLGLNPNKLAWQPTQTGPTCANNPGRLL